MTNSQRVKLDNWILDQFCQKNYLLLNQISGIHVIDRTPLDPLAFTPEDQMAGKAMAIKNGISPGESQRAIQSGQIVLLTGQPEDLESRVVGRHKESPSSVIDEMQINLLETFNFEGVVKIDTYGQTIKDVVRRVAHTIFLEDYRALAPRRYR